MRFLSHGLPLAGHMYPIAAIAHDMARRAHEVVWAAAVSFLRQPYWQRDRVRRRGPRLYRELRDFGMAATTRECTSPAMHSYRARRT